MNFLKQSMCKQSDVKKTYCAINVKTYALSDAYHFATPVVMRWVAKQWKIILRNTLRT